MGILWTKLTELFTSKQLEMVLVGLENSGKTTLLNVLSMGHPVETVPTVGQNVKVVKKENVQMKVWDLGGQERFRSEWARYTEGVDILIFVVDASDADRVPTARKELHRLLEDARLEKTPLLILLNKIDLEPHLSKEEMVKQLNLDYISENPWVVFPISALKQINIGEVVDWLINYSSARGTALEDAK
eukprot:gb/GECH01012256.1/.p1 GENE.gb/GECH01012256.1/~~gb/GECH01012256.1/.p1  ORF type:complete len:188 (+),score=33.26 gb/GECH01012256.1/:1-564(+)